LLRVGLTGGLSCGKSTVARLFAERGAAVIQADSIARELTRPGNSVYDQVVKQFGREILESDGSIDRAKLADLAFAGGRIAELNGIVHPAVRTRVLGKVVELEQLFRAGILIVDAALMVESGFYRMFDKIVVVACNEALQMARIITRDGLTPKEARARIASQMPVAEKLKVAHYTIDTSGTLRQTREQAEAVFSDLLIQERRLRNVE